MKTTTYDQILKGIQTMQVIDCEGKTVCSHGYTYLHKKPNEFYSEVEYYFESCPVANNILVLRNMLDIDTHIGEGLVYKWQVAREIRAFIAKL